MELRQLAYLVAVAEERSFTRAAAREHVAQPGVSAQVRKLEAELGVELFDRSAGTVGLTAAGREVLPFARAALAGAAGVRAAADDVAGLVRGRVAVGVVPSAGGWLADALARFHAEHPGVEITLAEDTSDALLDAVRGGGLDLALAGVAGRPPEGLRTAVVTDQELVAAVAPAHPLASRHRLAPVDLAAEALIALPRGTGGRAALDAAFAAAGMAPPRIAFEAGDPLVLLQLAERGLGVAIVPESAPEGLRVLRIAPAMRSRLELAWRAGQSPAARALLVHARRALTPTG
jgi:DNA-binding transcriptional LysR family regulator